MVEKKATTKTAAAKKTTATKKTTAEKKETIFLNAENAGFRAGDVYQALAAQVARVVNEVEFVVLNGNYALEAGYSVGKDAIAYEANDSIAAKTYVNIIAVEEGNENSDKIKAQ